AAGSAPLPAKAGHWSLKDSGVARHLNDSDAVFVTGLLAEMQPLLAVGMDARVRELAMRICGRLLQQRRALVTELLGADLVREGFELLAPARSGSFSADAGSVSSGGGGGDSEMEMAARAEAARFQCFTLWLADAACEAQLRDVFRRVTDR
ncbi:unnamed protein product, partial [Phaeothamnion confervicola]